MLIKLFENKVININDKLIHPDPLAFMRIEPIEGDYEEPCEIKAYGYIGDQSIKWTIVKCENRIEAEHILKEIANAL